MGEFLKKEFFTLVRMILVITFSIYGVIGYMDESDTGVSVVILLLVSLFVSVMAIKELVNNKKIVWLIVGTAVFIFLFRLGGSGFILVGYYLAYEYLSYFKAGLVWYLIPFAAAFIGSPVGLLNQFLVLVMLSLCYIQNEFVVSPFKKQVMEETELQQGLKRDIEIRESAARAELKKNMLETENQILEERASLSQTLHDKLGHNINGSIYQLEASKVVMDSDPEKARSMIQAVIDQLRTGMDEIRAILRKERPEKKKMAILQLHELCADCNNKGVEAELTTEGELGQIPSAVWEVILDNAFEAVSNSMKYSKCKHINISVIAMNKMVRCNVSDDGVGCKEIVDGMGISGMRQRVRTAGGTINFESEAGFSVNMLLPL